MHSYLYVKKVPGVIHHIFLCLSHNINPLKSTIPPDHLMNSPYALPKYAAASLYTFPFSVFSSIILKLRP
jgi:hypothetical protein